MIAYKPPLSSELGQLDPDGKEAHLRLANMVDRWIRDGHTRRNRHIRLAFDFFYRRADVDSMDALTRYHVYWKAWECLTCHELVGRSPSPRDVVVAAGLLPECSCSEYAPDRERVCGGCLAWAEYAHKGDMSTLIPY